MYLGNTCPEPSTSHSKLRRYRKGWNLKGTRHNMFPPSFLSFCVFPTRLWTIWCISLPPQWRRQWHPTPVLLPGKSHRQRSLVGCSPWGHEEPDTTERLPFHFSLSCIGEGNGNPLQCSCLENPRDGGAWWAAVYGVTQSQTWLKRLSSRSSYLHSTLSHSKLTKNEQLKIFTN